MRKSISCFHYITQDVPECPHQQQARMACIAGVEWIQLRVKNKTDAEWMHIAAEVREITDEFKVTLIINDSPFIAKSVNADGVHLGREDMSWNEARELLGENFIIGSSAHSLDDLLQARDAAVDYFGLGPVRFTATKENLDFVLGMDGVCEITSSARLHGFSKPIIAIGGIQLNDVAALLENDIYGVAVSSGVNGASDPENAIRQFLKQVNALNTRQGFYS